MEMSKRTFPPTQHLRRSHKISDKVQNQKQGVKQHKVVLLKIK